MAIRLRRVNNFTVALCAAETDEQIGDVYLDDAQHHALSTKFGLDWQSEGLIENPPVDAQLVAVMGTQKIRNAQDELERWSNER